MPDLGRKGLRPLARTAAALAAAVVLSGAAGGGSPAGGPVFADAFWKHWGDGRAELAGYDLTFPRYGSLRSGVAVTVFVTETFSNALRVKSDPGQHPTSDEYPVMKLNLVRDFSTGIYDYNLMTSSFIALAAVNGRPAGSPTKVSFSSQEWCGNVFAQLLFDAGSARYTAHSYFDGEADQQREVAVPLDALDGDALLVWARGFSPPLLARGESRDVPLLGSLETSRLTHRPLALGRATLTRVNGVTSVVVPAGRFEVERRTVAIAGGPTVTIDVERDEPHRIVRWQSTTGEKAELLGSDRLKYWEMHDPGGEKALEKLGLTPRGRRMP